MITIQHNDKGSTNMNTNLLTNAPLSATENLETIRRTQRATTENFIDASIAMFWIRELQQYKELGFKRLESFLDSQGIEVSKAQFHAMANLGSSLRWINTTREELSAVGYSAMIEIVRLAKSKDGAEKHKSDIARLITRKAKGLIDVKSVRDEVKALLGEGKVQAGSAPSSTATTEPAESDDTKTTPDWWADICAIKAKAGSDEAAFRAMMMERWGE